MTRDLDRSRQHPGEPAERGPQPTTTSSRSCARSTSRRTATSSAQANVRTPLTSSDRVDVVPEVRRQVPRQARRAANRNESTYTTPTTLKMTSFLETGFDLPPYLDGRYDLTPYISQSLVGEHPDARSPSTITRNHARDAEEFDGTERIAAGYAMAEIYAGRSCTCCRASATSTPPTISSAATSASRRTAPGSAPIRSASTANYGVAAAGASRAIRGRRRTRNLRFAVTRTLARPNYYDTVPYRAQDDNASTVALGNADLRPTKSWNVDALAEHYFKSVGVVSAGVFYKQLDRLHLRLHAAAGDQRRAVSGDPAAQRRRRDAHAASKVALQNQLRFLPSPLQRHRRLRELHVHRFDARSFRTIRADSTLPGQSRHVGNVAASYEKRRLQRARAR